MLQGENGATTVSGTMMIAHMVRALSFRPRRVGSSLCLQAGIKVFVTGGIGGVHREGHKSAHTVVTLAFVDAHPPFSHGRVC